VKVALTGGAYMARSVVASAQRSVNLFAEPMPRAQGEPMSAADYPTPGTRLLNTVGSGPIRGIRQVTTGGIYCVSGSGVYKVDPVTWVGTHLGDITPGLLTPVSMVDNGLDMVIVDGTANGWRITLVGDVFAPIANQIETLSPATITGTDPIVRDNGRYTPFVPTIGGIMSRATVSLGAGFLGHMKCSVFSAGLGSVLGSARTITSPAAGVNDLLFSPGVSVSAGEEYWLGFDCDQSAGTWNRGSATPGATSNTPFASFPVAAPHPTPASPLIVTVTIESDPDAMFVGADRVDYLDTFFLFNKPNTPQFYSSDSLALTFDPLWFANKESYSDLLRTLIVSKRDILLIGDKTTEVWSNVGKPDFPFEQQPGVFIDHGIAAKYSAAEYDNGVFWLTADRQGHGIVVMVTGYESKRISTYAIENEIAGYARIDDAIGFCYQLGGHTFYVLTFPHADKTWVHDITTGHWHEWAWIDANGEEHRHRANCHWPINGTLVVGDWQNGNLYALDHRVFTDNGRPIRRVRSFPHIVNDLKRVFYRQFIADMDVGTAPETISVGTETRVNATFAAADGTNLDAYTSEVGGGWTPVGGAANATIEGGQVVGTGGTALYQSAALILTPDYTLRFNAVPSAYDSVVAGTSLWAIGRATGAGTGYRVAVDADGTQYTLTLATLPSGASASVVMGTIASGVFTVSLSLRGHNISARVQRTVDGLFLRDDGTWRTDPGTTAVQFTDATYTAPGAVLIGGVWP
jgi:hypothetical protein